MECITQLQYNLDLESQSMGVAQDPRDNLPAPHIPFYTEECPNQFSVSLWPVCPTWGGLGGTPRVLSVIVSHLSWRQPRSGTASKRKGQIHFTAAYITLHLRGL